MARILKKNNISFEYSKEFETTDENGNPNHREVDFWLEKPIEVFWCDIPVQAIEVKGGRLNERCWFQKKELRNAGIHTFIAIRAYIDFWEHRGFLRSRGLFPRLIKRRRR